MLKVDNEKIEVDGTGTELLAEMTLLIIHLAKGMAEKSKGQMTKQDCVDMILIHIGQASRKFVEEV